MAPLKPQANHDMEDSRTEYRRLMGRKQALRFVLSVLGGILILLAAVLIIGVVTRATGTWQAAIGILLALGSIWLVQRQTDHTDLRLQCLEDRIQSVERAGSEDPE